MPPAVIDVKAVSVKGLQLLRDQQGNSYLLSSTDQQLAKHATIGGFGSGIWGGHDPNIKRAVKFQLPKGDSTMVILKKNGQGDDPAADDEEKKKAQKKQGGGEKDKVGTLQSILGD